MVSHTDLPTITLSLVPTEKNTYLLKEILAIIDHDAVRAKILELRNMLKVAQLLTNLVPLEKYGEWETRMKELYEGSTFHEEKRAILSAYPYGITLTPDENEKRRTLLRELYSHDPYHRFLLSIYVYRREYAFPKRFQQILEHAIVCGSINVEDCDVGYFRVIYPEFADIDLFRDPVTVLEFHPDAKIELLQGVISDRLNTFKATLDNEIYDLGSRSKSVFHRLPRMYKTENITRDRHYYWQHREGLSNVEIAKPVALESGMDPQDLADEVREAIKRYTELTSLPLF